MSSDLDMLIQAARMGDDGTPFVLLTVVSTKGSTPRNAGARMIWKPGASADGELLGTVGGGQFELLALDAARRHFQQRSCGMEKYVLGADADQCCGGVMEVFFEYVGPSRRIVIFGAGHVARELVRLLAPAGHDVIVADDRPDWNSRERFPAATPVHSWDEAIAICRRSPASTLAVVMTCSHDTDFDLLRRLLESPPAFTGLIGSRSKRACLFGRLVASGASPDAVQAVHCPVGVGDCGKEPALVAVSIAAQLLLVARSLPRL